MSLSPRRQRIIVGTAGHIDHGKTSLVRALTGVDTDRLKEEKLRGITIELGFADWRPSPEAIPVSFVDMPGHERFVRQMIAGATGIDLVLLVVAADEGVMPQTREHLDICRLLGISRGIAILSKTDLVEREWLELVRDDVEGYLATAFGVGWPLLEFSTRFSEAELARFCDALAALISATAREPMRRDGLFRLPIDRVFSLHGFGTIVTG
ncbi:MAG: GTP-binding protein, partial [Myxococcales bacterium]|nr:GTP-binding protein [Myxococcales bacterium]